MNAIFGLGMLASAAISVACFVLSSTSNHPADSALFLLLAAMFGILFVVCLAVAAVT